MDDSRSKAIQYWKQVHNVGSVVFRDVSNEADSLNTLLNILVNSQLLGEIECLSYLCRDEQEPCPFTTWLLQGIFFAAAANSRNPSLEKLCIESQSKLLTAAYYRTVCEYQHLIRKYFTAIEMTCSITIDRPFSCFLERDYVLDDVTLVAENFVITTEKQRLRFMKLLFQVVEGTLMECFLGCESIHDEVWEAIAVMCETGTEDLVHLPLALLIEVMLAQSLPTDEEVLLRIFSSLPTLLVSEKLCDPENKDKFLNAWHGIKKQITFSTSETEVIITRLTELKSSCVIEDFAVSEIGAMIANLGDGCNWLQYLKKSLEWPLYEQVLILEGCIVKELLASPLLNGKEPLQANNFYSVCHLSNLWKDFLSKFLSLVSRPRAASGKIHCASTVVKVVSRILEQCSSHNPSTKLSLQFFDGDFRKVLNCITQHLGETEFNKVACEAFACLMNFPEATNLLELYCREPVNLVVRILTAPNSNMESEEKANLLRGLRNVPSGILPDPCVQLFVRYGAGNSQDELTPLTVVESVPFLFLSGRTSPTHLIADILMPATLTDRADLRLAALEAASDLVCAVAGTAISSRCDGQLPKIKCLECSMDGNVNGSQGEVPLIESHINKLITPLFTATPPIRRRLLSLVPRFSMHMQSLRSPEMINNFIIYLRDGEVDVRRELAGCMSSLLFGHSLVVRGKAAVIPDEEAFPTVNGTSPVTIALDYCFDALEKEINLQLDSEQWGERMETLLSTLVNIASFPARGVLKRSLKLLLLFMGTCPFPLSSFVSSICGCHKTTPLVLYYKYRAEISEVLGNLIVRNQLKFGCPARVTLSCVFFKGLSKVSFAAGSDQYIVPILVIAATKQEQLKVLLIDYADYFEVPLGAVITKSFPYIYAKAWLDENSAVFKHCMNLVEQMLTVKIPDLILHSQKMIIHQLLFNYHQYEDKVLKGLSQVISGASPLVRKDQIACSLESRFVGYLLFLVGRFTKEENAESEQLQALGSLTAVLELMGGQYVTPVARKVLATLITMHSLDSSAHASLLCKAWFRFVQLIESKELGPLLATIVVTILPLLDHAEADVVRILTFLLVDKKPAISGYIPKLIFLRNRSPALQPIVDTIEKRITFKNEDIKDRLARETALATHETVGVRVEGLKALLYTFQDAAADVQSLIIGSDVADNCATALREALLNGCRDSDQEISNIAALCLGELGAVDPSLLPRLLKPHNVLPLSAHDPDFGYLALIEILRGFQNARSSVDMDAFAIGLQELLKIYSVTESDDNATWKKFSASEHSLLRPMLSSRYTVQAPVRDSWPAVIFGAREAGSHMTWAALWASKLIALCTDSRAVVLFRACEPSMKRDSKILLFFLKYIVLHVITQDMAFHSDILKEMEAVTSLSPENWPPRENSTLLPIRLVEYSRYPSIRTSITAAEARACAMTVFLLVDFFNYWTRSYLSQNHTQNGDHLRRRDYSLVQDFLAKIDLKKVAAANFELQEYPRTVQYIEDIMRSDQNSSAQHLPMLSKLYALYGDLDSVSGARALQQCDTGVEEQLFYHQMSRQLEEARILYEQLGKSGGMSPSQIAGMVQCYLQLGEPTVAHGFIKSQIQQKPELAPVLSESLAECMLKLGDWNSLSKSLRTELSEGQRSWFTQLCRITHNLREGTYAEVDKCLKATRSDLIRSFTALGSESGNEQHGYHYLVRLQILNEVERVRVVATIKHESKLSTSLQSMFKEWDAKLNLVQSGGDYLEQVLYTRRALLSSISTKFPQNCEKLIKEQLGKYWVKSAEVARKSGCFHQSYNYIVSAEHYNIPLTFIEKAKLLWDKGKQEESLATLTKGLTTYFPDAHEMKSLSSGERLEERKMAAEALLLYAMYNEETSNCSSLTNKSNYQEAYEMCKELEKTQVLLAQCMDRCLSLLGDSEEDEKKACEFRLIMVNYFGRSLLSGCEYVYQTVPRMLSIWFDLGENLSTPDRYSAMCKMNRLIKAFLERLPPFVFMTALPQLLSRIGHPNRELYSILKSIIVSLIRAFPQQCLWAVQTLAKSSVHERSSRYKEMISDPALQTDGRFKLIQDFTTLCDKLNRLTNVNLPQDSTSRGLLVSNVMRDLPLLVKSDNFSPIIVPITRFCAISLPKDVTSATHQPFPKNPVTIAGIQNEMTVLPSLQRPRKISFLGSDGKLYDILCKPKDDLRRDARLMEFNNIVNMYLHRDPDSRARQLRIRTYVVTPLGESGGLLEWVPKLVGLRPALFQLYKQYGKFVSPRDVRKFETNVKDSLAKKREIFVDKLLPLHPPIFHEWFRLTFPDPAGWYAARLAYIRTTAVISMVGYILGLGDRHGENILFDCESGDTVHVDFNCLFNKGEQFQFKERVPFRLTQNMVSAMGPCGVEGTFRKSCETSMRVLRAQGKTLMSVLTPAAYDPFGSWGKNKQIILQERDQKIAEALEELSDIEKRLNGSLRVKQKNGTFYLSVEGLVRSLITEATSVDNLCQMYLGWGAYL